MTSNASSLLEFAQKLLTARGSTVSSPGKDLLEVKLSPELRQKLRRDNVTLAFSEEAAGISQDTELVTPGSHFFSILLSLARQRGLSTRRVAREKTKNVNQFLKQVTFENFSVEITDRERYYHAFLRFHFELSYCTVDSTHELRSVTYDVASHKICSEPESYWDGLDFEPGPKEQCLPPISEDEFSVALREAASNLIGRVRHKVNALRARSRNLLDRELDRLESYYRGLILDEDLPAADAFSRAFDDSKKVDSYKLEWQRKAAAEAQRFQPRVHLSLVGAEEISVPRCLLTLRADAHPFTEFFGVYDLAAQAARGAFCQGCSNLHLSVRLHGSGAVLCEDCYAQPDKVG
jgi:hypothetical protein